MNKIQPEQNMMTKMANAIRFLAMDAVQAANSGHPGMPMGMADVASVLFSRFMRVDPSQPGWPDRDRFILSAGHGSMLLYAIHHLLGYEDMPMEEIRNFRQWGARTAGHPEYGHAAGIETTTGPLGQGISTAVGMALAERVLNARFGDDLVDHYTYVLAGDGCLMEGISHEAIDLAGHLGLSRIVVLWDDNNITIDGEAGLSTSMDQKARFEAAGWHVSAVDGHDASAIEKAIEAARKDARPSLIACRTTIGFGAPNKAGSHDVHGAPLGDEEIAATRENLGWSHEAFVVPDEIKSAWEAVGARGKEAREEWESRLGASKNAKSFNACQGAIDQAALKRAMQEYREKLIADKPKVATRKASQMALEVVNEIIPNTLGGSADLTGSNLTKTSQTAPISAGDFAGRYIHYGVREHGMAAAMNGIALHGGLIPYGGTFLVFADYMRGAMRLSALMGVRVIYVLTHDSIGLGEDGPTHQPVETLASLRAMPNMLVLRPCDAVETNEAWEIALNETNRPSVLALSRQGLPCLRDDAKMQSDKGGYLLKDVGEERDVTLIASGSEVSIAMEAADKLAGEGIKAAIVSLPSFELFAKQDEAYQESILGRAPRIGIEAAIRQGWDGLILRKKDRFIGMSGFGASAPAEALYENFGITSDAIIATAKELI